MQHQPQAILWFRNYEATGPPIFALDLRTTTNQQNSQSNHKLTNLINQTQLDEQQIILNNRISLDELNVNSNFNTSLNDDFLRSLQLSTSFVSDAYRDRVQFNVTNELPFLTISKVKEDDQGVYLCR